ncbi:hypothetical protein [Halapricum hydrolyticum]|uniref:Uncharacterized protein n=1 Tax=Halapricum hydrolyticum TaxID=2979991 RepID=A0AAE3I9J1_9EURY|nr:hypothetical protein [Halapricum hydrolyticum]MCU4716866.1 hypothetical protein [Halapricum hydrolyticum]MCU4725529.1 hypothetical protein [Halapricum hydrolyticum]
MSVATDMTDSMDVLADPDMWETAAATAGGYVASSIAQNMIDGRTGFDVPNEAYGLAVAGVGYGYSPMYRREIATGGLIYTVDALAQRFDVKQSVTNLGGN